MKTARLLLGTSGYDYPEWKGVFYPQNLKRKDFLAYYATVFNALELNNTFYNMPTAERLISFWERSEGRLSFSVKASRLLTHEITPSWKDTATDFKNAVAPLAEKDSLCAVLFQFPQSFHYTPENRIYLADLLASFASLPMVVEFRHRDWIRQSVFDGLEECGASIAFCDMPRLSALPAGNTAQTAEAVRTPFVGNTAYIRLHGRNADAWYCHDEENNGCARYRYDYSDAEIAEFVPVIRRAQKEGRRTAVFFNNHPDGSGAKNAKRLREMCAERGMV